MWETSAGTGARLHSGSWGYPDEPCVVDEASVSFDQWAYEVRFVLIFGFQLFFFLSIKTFFFVFRFHFFVFLFSSFHFPCSISELFSYVYIYTFFVVSEP